MGSQNKLTIIYPHRSSGLDGMSLEGRRDGVNLVGMSRKNVAAPLLRFPKGVETNGEVIGSKENAAHHRGA